MDYLQNILMEKKYYESMDEVDQLLQDNDVDKNSIIQSLVLSKEVYPNEEDARLFAREHGFVVEEVEETTEAFIIPQLDRSEFVEESMRSIQIRTGITAIVGVLKRDAVENGPSEVYLSLRNEEGIKLNGNLPHIIELAKVVNGTHVNYGKVEITKEMLQSFARNFNEGVVGVDLMIDYDHEQRGAAGWVKSVFLDRDGNTLLGEVKWTPKGAQCLSDREFRYFSPEFSLNYTHPHTGVQHGPTLLGGGLVNRPFLKMDAIVSFKERNKKQNSEVKMETIAMSEHKAITSDLEKQISDYKLSELNVKKVVDGQKEEITKLSEKVKELEAEKKQAEEKAKNEKLFNEGKINAAQLEALNEGKDFYEVLNLSETMNNEPQGATGNQDNVVLSEADEKAMKAMGLSKEDYVKYNS
jgi:phage I-like protein